MKQTNNTNLKNREMIIKTKKLKFNNTTHLLYCVVRIENEIEGQISRNYTSKSSCYNFIKRVQNGDTKLMNGYIFGK